MRPVLFILCLVSCGSVCCAQIDSSRTVNPPLTTTHVPIPGVDTPLSGPGTMLQSPPQPNAVVLPEKGRKNRSRKTVPPSDPRAFGVAVPIGQTKKDSIR